MKKVLPVFLVLIVVSGCGIFFNNPSDDDSGSGLAKLAEADIWIMDAVDAGQYSQAGIPRTEDKLRITADGTAEIWGARGLWQEMTYTQVDANTLEFTTTREAYGVDSGSWKGDYSFSGDTLQFHYYGTREDGSTWEANRSFTAGSQTTPLIYSEDFEDGEARFVSSHKEEWTIKDDGGNNVLAPTSTADGWSDAQFNIIAGKDFVFSARFKMIEDQAPDRLPDMWIGFQQDVDVDHSVYVEPEPTFELRGYSDCNIDPEYDENSDDDRMHYPIPTVEWGTWYDIEIRVQDGKKYQFLLNDSLVDTIETPEAGFVESIKVWGNPNDREWYIDDVNVSYPKVKSFSDFTLSDQDLFYIDDLRNNQMSLTAMSINESDPSDYEIYSLYQSNYTTWTPEPIPGSEKLVFNQSVDSNIDVYTLNTDGSGLTRITDNDSQDWGAVPTPDGSQFIFQSDRDGNFRGDYDIFIMDADGSNITNLTSTLGEIEGLHEISPNGTKIAYAYRASNSNADELYVMDLDGSNQTRLTNTIDYDTNDTNDGDAADDARITRLAWSPDGSEIVFTMDKNDNREDGGGALFRVSSDTGDAPYDLDNIDELVSSDTEYYSDPDYSPDGSKIVFCAKQKIYILDAETAGATPELVRKTKKSDPAQEIGQEMWSPQWLSFNSDGTFK